MNEIAHEAIVIDATPASVYARWCVEPKYRLNNLAGDAPAWRFVGLAELELLAFDQCLVFGATYPGDATELPATARRDAVVRQARDVTWAVYRVYATRASVDRRLRLAYELAAAVDAGTGSAGSLLPLAMCDGDATVVAEAQALRDRLAEAARA